MNYDLPLIVSNLLLMSKNDTFEQLIDPALESSLTSYLSAAFEI